MPDERTVKQDIISRYDTFAGEQDNEEWLKGGGDSVVPEKPAGHYFVERKIARALQMCGTEVTESSRLLEVGCSFGQMTTRLATRFKSLTAVDIAPKTIELAEKRARLYGLNNIKFVCDDAERMDQLEDESFDVAFSFSTIRYCPNPIEALKAIQRKLRPGGIAIVDFPNRYCLWHLVIKRLTGTAKHEHDTLYTAGEARAALSQAGLKVERLDHFLFTNRSLPTKLLPVAKLADAVLERIPLVRRLAGIIMVKGRRA